MNDKPKLIPIPKPADPERDRADLSKPFPIEYGGRWWVEGVGQNVPTSQQVAT